MLDQTAPPPSRVLSSPRCRQCAGATAVQRITPSYPGQEQWTIRCNSCGHVYQIQVASNPSPPEPLDWFERSLGALK